MTDDLINIETFEFIQEAEAARDLLEEEGIHAFVSNADIMSMNWALGNAIGYVKLQVPQDRAEMAIAILRERRESLAARRKLPGTEPGATACLECNAAIPAGRRDCPACGWSYGVDLDVADGEGAEVDDDADLDEVPAALDAIRAAKRPVFWLLLTPVIAAVVALAVALVAWLVNL
jgi:hypothetical protein